MSWTSGPPAACATAFTALALMTGGGPARALLPPAVGADIEDFARLLRKKGVDRDTLARRAAAIRERHDDLNDLMAIYKPTKSKGLGWNPNKKGPGDGIEKRIIDLGTKKELTKAELAKEKDHIVRAAYLNLAMVEIAKGFTPPKAPGAKVAPWDGFNEEMKAGSEEALEAVKANDPAALKKAMKRIDSGCNGCHAYFRSPPFQKELEDLAHLLRDGKVALAQLAVAAVRKDRPLGDIMAKVYKPTRLGGIGYDPAMGGPADGIEGRMTDLGKKELTEAQVRAEKDLLLRAAYYNLAITEITKAYAPAKPVEGKGAKEWGRHNGEVASGARDVIAAVNAKDPKALKRAMGKIAAGCGGCHADFRKGG
jgi:hypothetical protein